MVQLKLIFLFFAICLANTNGEVQKLVATYISLGNSTNSTKGSKCGSPSPSDVDPDKCCKFPELFPDSLVGDCEKDFSLNSTTTASNEMLADSCVVECVFNKSSLNKQSKVNRDDVVKVLTLNAKNDVVWTPLITKAVDICFKELDSTAIDDFVNYSMNDTISKLKIPTSKLCHPISGFILDCIFFELFKICPQEKFNQTMVECVALKNRTTECDDW